jgi:hypothetical protein
MQCKLEKSYYTSFSRWTFLFSLALSPLIDSSSSLAVMTIAPIRGGTQGQTTIANSTQGVINYYYFVTQNGVPDISNLAGGFLNFIPIDIAGTASSDSGVWNHLFEFNIGTNTPFSPAAGQYPTLIVQAMGPLTGPSPRPAPIASVNGIACNNLNCQAYNQNGTVPVVNGIPVRAAPYYAAKLSSQPIRIGVYLKDICADYLTGGVTLAGCAADGSVNTPGAVGAARVTLFPLKFIIQYASDTVSAPTGQVIDSTPNSVNLNLQNTVSTATCPTQAALNQSAQPDDSRIGLDTGLFNYSSVPGAAPAQKFVVVAKEQPASGAVVNPVVDSTFASANDVVSQNNFGGVIQASGFTNSDVNATHNYLLSFLIQDQAGVWILPSGGGAQNVCTYGPIQTVDVKSFLQKNGCFIASAAFGDSESAPVLLLRAFRDQVLLKFSWGRAFVQSYYEWSPELAQKLNAYPFFKLPVLLGLFYLQVFAVLSLYPVFLFALLVLSISTAFFAVYWVKRTSR